MTQPQWKTSDVYVWNGPGAQVYRPQHRLDTERGELVINPVNMKEWHLSFHPYGLALVISVGKVPPRWSQGDNPRQYAKDQLKGILAKADLLAHGNDRAAWFVEHPEDWQKGRIKYTTKVDGGNLSFWVIEDHKHPLPLFFDPCNGQQPQKSSDDKPVFIKNTETGTMQKAAMQWRRDWDVELALLRRDGVIDHHRFQKSFASVLISGFQPRWAGDPCIIPEGLSHHQWHVALLMICLFPDLSLNEIVAALLHDTAEDKVGDMDAKTKRENPLMAEQYERVENQIREARGVFINTLTKMQKARLKVADVVAAHMHLIMSGRIAEERQGWYEDGARDRIMEPFAPAEQERLLTIINSLLEQVKDDE